jgi:HPt (histidine-containing phosphotransfer) domain-containing protein
MNVPIKPTLSEKVRALRARFRNGLPDRLAAIARSVATIDAVQVDELTRQFHWLAGTAASYQFYDIAELAAEAEALCEEYAIGATLHSVLAELQNVASDLADAPFLLPEVAGVLDRERY